MTLRILLPTETLVEREVKEVCAEAQDGCFCLLPKHIDFAAGLVRGLLSFITVEGEEQFAAIEEGVLIKCGHEVTVSTLHAVLGPDLGRLKSAVGGKYEQVDERERLAGQAAERLESEFVRRVYQEAMK